MIIVNNKNTGLDMPVNIDHIIAVYPKDDGCIIVVPANNYCDDIPCKENFGEVLERITKSRQHRARDFGFYASKGRGRWEII